MVIDFDQALAPLTLNYATWDIIYSLRHYAPTSTYFDTPTQLVLQLTPGAVSIQPNSVTYNGLDPHLKALVTGIPVAAFSMPYTT